MDVVPSDDPGSDSRSLPPCKGGIEGGPPRWRRCDARPTPPLPPFARGGGGVGRAPPKSATVRRIEDLAFGLTTRLDPPARSARSTRMREARTSRWARGSIARGGGTASFDRHQWAACFEVHSPADSHEARASSRASASWKRSAGSLARRRSTIRSRSSGMPGRTREGGVTGSRAWAIITPMAFSPNFASYIDSIGGADAYGGKSLHHAVAWRVVPRTDPSTASGRRPVPARRARGGAVAAAPTRVSWRMHELRRAVAVHHRDALADPAGVPDAAICLQSGGPRASLASSHAATPSTTDHA